MPPASVPFADLHAQYLSLKSEIDQAISAVIGESAFIRGSFVDHFEKNFKELLGIEHCISCGNGTDAIYIAMKGLGIKPGDEVITTAHSWISTSETISQAGGKVVFCDTTPDTFTIDPEQIKAKITQRTVGIIPVHLYGHPANMDPIIDIANKNNLWVVEDCAQAHLARYKSKVVGTIGTAGTFSFYPGKNLGAMGDAGAIVTQDSKLAAWCALFARHGGKGEHQIEGINSRMDGIQAAILNVKIPRLEDWTKKRQLIAKKYDEMLAGIGDIEIPKVSPDVEHVYHLYVIKTRSREAIQMKFKENNIGFSINYPKALPFYPAYSSLGHKPSDFPNAYGYQDRILSLPMFPEMTDNQQEIVVRSICNSF
jgi:dTDP-4-amino-4,6-dideoxygalactose transaminase